MRGYDENNVWVDEPITEVQRSIVTSLGFQVPDPWAPVPWSCGAFASDDTPVVIRHLPYLPAVNAALKSVGFRWDSDRREWYGEDRTKAQIEVLQSLSFCSGRYYPAVEGQAMLAAPEWAIECGPGAACPVRVGAYG